MGTPAAVREGQPSRSFLSQYAAYLAAGPAIIAPYPLFALKAAKQMGVEAPHVFTKEMWIKAISATPKIGAAIAMQLKVQEVTERFFFKEQKPTPTETFACSMLVSMGLVPPLVVLNAHFSNRGAIDALKGLDRWQFGAITVREAFFLSSLRISGPIGESMKRVLGDNKQVEYGSTFFTGAFGSILGHFADTFLTRRQENLPFDGVKGLMRGCMPKAGGVGFFLICYNGIKKELEKQ